MSTVGVLILTDATLPLRAGSSLSLGAPIAALAKRRLCSSSPSPVHRSPLLHSSFQNLPMQYSRLTASCRSSSDSYLTMIFQNCIELFRLERPAKANRFLA